VGDSCGLGNESSGSIKESEIFDLLRDYQLLKKNFPRCS
jgi:hypothetical protein